MLFYLQRAFLRDIERHYLCNVKTQLEQSKIELVNIKRLQTDNTETKPMMYFTIMVTGCIDQILVHEYMCSDSGFRKLEKKNVFCKIGSLPVARFIPCSISLYVESCNLNSKIKK